MPRKPRRLDEERARQLSEANARLAQLSTTDALTGVANRRVLDDLVESWANSIVPPSPYAVLMVDVDRFKNINDSLGHAAGDTLLKVIATRLTQLLRKTDMVARLGGDEFVVLLENCIDAAMLANIATRALSAINETLCIENCCFQVRGSIGISMYPEDCQDAATMLKHADAAMYLAKSKGKNNFQFYTTELAERAEQQFSLESDLRQAVEREEFQLLYQPKINIASGKMVAVEALIRWRHPTRGLISPDRKSVV